MAEEKPLVADVSVQTEEQETPVTDASVKTEAELSNEQALRGWGNEQGGANLPLFTPTGECLSFFFS